MKNKRTIGVHLRLNKTYAQILQEAISYNVTCCQFFFMPQFSNKYLRLTNSDKNQFLELRRTNNMMVYAHSSYWINAATGNLLSSGISQSLLRKEIRLAQQLEIPYIVLHGGTAKGFTENPDDLDNKLDGLRALAKILNNALKNQNNIMLLVENTAHAKKAVCSDLQDFVILKSLLNEPEKVGFCIDTAHAFAYGYNIENTEKFIDLLDQTMGLKNINLIHLNDSEEECCTKLDAHALPGRGLIGDTILKKFALHPKMEHIPLILEPPLIAFEEIKKALDGIKGW